MLPIKKILLPVDFSDRCLRMTGYARQLAARYEAELTLLHVVNPMYSFPPTAISGPTMVPIPNTVIDEREKNLEEFAINELKNISLRRLVYEGDPAEQIAEFVANEDIQLVVMPTHGYGILRRFLIGSVTAKVLHDVACPVLTGVHLDPHHDGSLRLSNIICAVDLDSNAEATLSWAAQLAGDLGAQLAIVHVTADTERIVQAREEVNRLQEATGTASASLYVQAGDPANTVCSLATTMETDLLVAGRGAREDLTGALTTTAYAIVRQSPCPVISV